MAHNPLSAVPVASPHTHAEPLPGMPGLLLRREEPPRGRLSQWLHTRLGWKRERRFELDAVGALFWSEIDGKRSLGEIQQTLSESFGFDQKQASRAVVEFTSALMRRGLVALKLEPGRGEPAQNGCSAP